jgi:hypothetical protein
MKLWLKEKKFIDEAKKFPFFDGNNLDKIQHFRLPTREEATDEWENPYVRR